MKRGKLVVISGPSGVGQDTIIDKFIAKHPDWWLNVSATTRAEVRPGEVPGKDMIFLSEPEFKKLQDSGKLIESFKFADHWYGTLREPVEQKLAAGTNVFIRPEAKGAIEIKKRFPEAVLIFLNAESPEALEQRLRSRGTEDEAEIQRRMRANAEKLQYIDRYDHVVVNPTGHPEKAVAEIERIILN